MTSSLFAELSKHYQAPLNRVDVQGGGGWLCSSCEEHLQSLLKTAILSGSDESINSVLQTLRSESLPLWALLLEAVHAAVDESKDLLPIVQAKAAHPKASAAEQFALCKGKPFHDPNVPMLSVLKKANNDGLWYSDRSAVSAAVKLLLLAARHLVTDRARAIDLVMKGQYKTAGQQFPEIVAEPLEYVISRLARAEVPGRYGLDNHVYREALEVMVATKSETAAQYALRHLNSDTVQLIAQLGPVVVQPLCLFAADNKQRPDERVSAIQALEILHDASSLGTLSTIAERDDCNVALTNTHVVNVGQAAARAVAVIRESMSRDAAGLEPSSQQAGSTPHPRAR